MTQIGLIFTDLREIVGLDTDRHVRCINQENPSKISGDQCHQCYQCSIS